ncbi:MAG: acyltransferase [Proteobacteria bacterium]|nr:acyltransferase [Pseudomonadota bacterium]
MLSTENNNSTRLGWVDYARGVAILLVVNVHCAAGIQGSTLAMPEPFGSLYYAGMLGFAMALFFFLSGVIASGATERSPGAHLRGKWWGVVYPYLLWSTVLVVLRSAMNDQVNNPMELDRLATIAWDPVQQMWFLYALLFCFAAYAVLRCLPWWLHLGVALAMNMGQSTLDAGVLNECLAHYLFFCLGSLSAVWLKRAAGTVRMGDAVGLLLVYGVAVTHYAFSIVVPDMWGAHPVVATMPRWIHVALLGIAAAVAVCAVAARGRTAPWLATLGRYSLAIYMTHLFATAGTRIVMQQVLGVDSVAMHVLAGTMAGIVFPLTICFLSRSLGVGLLMGFGSAATSPRTPGVLPSSPLTPVVSLGELVQRARRAVDHRTAGIQSSSR